MWSLCQGHRQECQEMREWPRGLPGGPRGPSSTNRRPALNMGSILRGHAGWPKKTMQSSLIRNDGHFDQGLRINMTWWDIDLELRERKVQYHLHVASTETSSERKSKTPRLSVSVKDQTQIKIFI